MNRTTRPAGRGPLRPIEVAEAAVLADVTVALCLLGWLLPIGSVLIAVAVTPMAVIAIRNRPRAVIAGGVAGMTVAFLIAGTGLTTNVAGCAVLGALIGASYRRRWGVLRTVGAAALLIWPPAALASLALLAVLTKLRRLALDQISNTWSGTARLLRDAHLYQVARAGDTVTRWAVGHWWLSVPASLLAGTVTAAWIARVLAWPVLQRLSLAAPAFLPSNRADDRPDDETQEAGPVPVELRDVEYTYPGADHPVRLAGGRIVADGPIESRPGAVAR